MLAAARAAVVSICLLPGAASAAPVWVDWTLVSSASATGTLGGGRTATFTAGTAGVQGVTSAATGGANYTASPPVPGLASGESAESVNIVTATPHPTVINDGDLIFEVELQNFPIDGDTTIGLRDLWLVDSYRIELLDGSRSVLALTSVQLSSYDLSYASGFVADLGATLDASTGMISSDLNHNLGSIYAHSGLVLFTNLPTQTHYVRLYAGKTQQSEGISFYLGGSPVPEPSILALLGLGALAVALRR